MTAKIFVFVIASFNDPIFIDLIKYKKKQFKKYNIPHYFVFDDYPPSGFSFDKNDLFFEKEPVNQPAIFFPEQSLIVSPSERICPSLNPHMIRKFLKALKYINEDDYDFIIRVNLSTFINLPRLTSELFQYKNEKCMVLSPFIYQHLYDWEEFNEGKKVFTLFSGTCIILTKDLIFWLKMIDLQSPILFRHYDDTVLSYILHKIVHKTFNYKMKYIENTNILSDTEIFNETIFRIKNNENRSSDLMHWKYLLSKIDDIEVY